MTDVESSDDDDISFFMRRVPVASTLARKAQGEAAYSSDHDDDDDDHDDRSASFSHSRPSSSASSPFQHGRAKEEGVYVLSGSDAENDPAARSGARPTQTSAISGASEAPNGRARRSGGKKRRSPSVTPPPGPPEIQLQAARALVRAHLASTRAHARRLSRSPSHASSSSDHDQDTHGIASALRSNDTSTVAAASTILELDPELARYYRGKDAQLVRERAKRAERERFERRKRQLSERRSASVGLGATIADEARDDQVGRGGNRGGRVGRLSEEGEGDGESDDVVEVVSAPLRRKGPTSPASDTGRGGGKGVAIPISSSSDEGGAASHRPTRPGDEPSTSDTYDDDPPASLQLHLKSRTHSLPITVRPTTAVSRIVAHFVNTHRQTLPPEVVRQEKPVRLVFEGDTLGMDVSVEAAALEDGDQVEVVW